MTPENTYSTWVEIDLGAIEHNVRYVRSLSGVEVMAIVKANGYGHGAVPVAQAALRGGATWCGVARFLEARALREAGIDCPILVLGYIPADRVAEAIARQISLTVWNREQVEQAARLAQETGAIAFLHLKVDTGMSRIGAPVEHASALAEFIAGTPGVALEGLFTHYARADEADPATTDEQECLFTEVIKELAGVGLQPKIIHAANSAATLTRPSSYFSLVRLGIAMYGLHPSEFCSLNEDFRPALTWKAVISQVKILATGQGVSYGHEYFTQGNERIGTVPFGYADGFRREKPNTVLVGGQRVPVVGRVCMDQVMIQLDRVPEAKAGDEVVIVGRQGEENITVEEVAERWGTINYEVVCGIGARVPRVHLS